jgi:hypothetical protein
MKSESIKARIARFGKMLFDVNRLGHATAFITVLIMSVAITVLTGSIKELNTTPLDMTVRDFSNKENYFALMAAAVAIMTLFSFTLTYLNKKRGTWEVDEKYGSFEIDSSYIKKIQRDISRLKRITSIEIGQESEGNISSLIKDEIEKIAYKSVFESIKSKIDASVRLELDIESFSKSIPRIVNEIELLKTRGNVHLSIGIIATLIGIIMLSVIVFTQSYNDISIEKFLMHFIPRISLVVFVQIFAFFFLKLYRNNMEEVKYFHNELTSVESRISAVVLAKDAKNSEGMTKVIAELSAVDRNAPHQAAGAREGEQSIDMLTKLLSAVAPLIRKD